jgi:hypothetical protein
LFPNYAWLSIRFKSSVLFTPPRLYQTGVLKFQKRSSKLGTIICKAVFADGISLAVMTASIAVESILAKTSAVLPGK